MSDFLLAIPEEMVDQARIVASKIGQPVEDVLLEPIRRIYNAEPALPADEEAELSALEWLTDDALWTIARERLPKAIAEESEDLGYKNNMGTITDAEYERLTEIVERNDRVMLRKATATAILTKRGHTVRLEDLRGA